MITDKIKERGMSLHHSVNSKSHTDCSGNELGPPHQWKKLATNHLLRHGIGMQNVTRWVSVRRSVSSTRTVTNRVLANTSARQHSVIISDNYTNPIVSLIKEWDVLLWLASLIKLYTQRTTCVLTLQWTDVVPQTIQYLYNVSCQRPERGGGGKTFPQCMKHDG